MLLQIFVFCLKSETNIIAMIEENKKQFPTPLSTHLAFTVYICLNQNMKFITEI